jgi:hypothetical protein
MKVTNIHNVPQTLVALANRDSYSKGKADYSVTELLSPPRIQRLRAKHYHEMSQDVSDMLWQMLGSALHVVAEGGKAENHITEERLFLQISGVVLSGAIDLQVVDGDLVDIVDYKFTSAWSLRNDKPDWEQQGNMYAYMVETLKKKKVRSIKICALVRDWSRREAAINPQYPQAPIAMVSIPIWVYERTDNFIKQRIELHHQSKVLDDFGDELPECTEEDRWVRDTKWAVMKEGRKSAVRLFDSEEEAQELGSQPKHFIVERKGESIRCGFCGVNKWCSQFKRMQNENEG